MDHGLGPVHGGPAWRHGRETTGEWPRRRSSSPVLTGGGQEGEGRCGGLTTGLTKARGAAARLRWTGSGDGAQQGHASMQERMREGR
jgi:hypothetical protein